MRPDDGPSPGAVGGNDGERRAAPGKAAGTAGSRPVLSRREAVAGLVAVASGAGAVTTVLAEHWRGITGATGVIALGSGSALSVLVRTPSARVVVAAGDDPDAFDRAFASVGRPTGPRLDLLVSAGRDDDAAVPAALAGRGLPRMTLAIVPPGAAARDGALGGGGFTGIDHPTRVDLHDGVTMTLEPGLGPAGTDWRIVVARGASRLVLVPDFGSLALADASGVRSATVVLGAARQILPLPAGDEPLIVAAMRRGSPFDAVAVPEPAATVPETDDATGATGRWIWVVGDGDAVTGRFGPGQMGFERRGARRLAGQE